MVLAVQSYAQFKALGLDDALGSVIDLSLVRELGPVLAATMLAGRVGSAMAAGAGHDAGDGADRLRLESMGAESAVLPRRAAVPGLPRARPHAHDHGRFHGRARRRSLIRTACSASTTTTTGPIPAEYVDAFDFLMGIFKSFFFGAAIALVSCHHGSHREPGAEGVGKAATNAFVHSFVMILVLDLFLGIWLNNVHDFFRPKGLRKLL